MENRSSDDDLKIIMSQLTNHELVRQFIIKSCAKEKELRKVIDEKVVENDKLRIELEMERSKNVMKGEINQITLVLAHKCN
jgi:hypothetical protein